MEKPIDSKKTSPLLWEDLARRLLNWYAGRRRPFPWREEATPYRVWVSEIMLQQTRIEAALPYFERFINALPTVRALAEVEDDRLLKLWEGLGYYSRARNLKKAARIILNDCGGVLPPEYDKLLRLPGVGEYTAGAVASIAFGRPVPAVDGNVLRVMARLLNENGNITAPSVKAGLKKTVCAMLPEDRPGDFNQALMELGETVCLPHTAPRCGECPFSEHCEAHLHGNPEKLPARPPKKERRIEKRTVLVILSEQKVLLHQREKSGLLAGMWELPGAEGWITPEQAAKETARLGAAGPVEAEALNDGRHIFSHIEWRMKGFLIETGFFEPPPGCLWADARLLREKIALPSAFRPYAASLPR